MAITAAIKEKIGKLEHITAQAQAMLPRGREVPDCGGAVRVCTSRNCRAGGLGDRADRSVGRSYVLIGAGWRVGEVRSVTVRTGARG